jgi:hypothetical protein
MCSLDRKVGGILVNQNYGRTKRQNLVLPHWEFRDPKRGKSVHDE